jgi:hypothetical protein
MRTLLPFNSDLAGFVTVIGLFFEIYFVVKLPIF